ncbi:MAG: cobalamin biosynthesis protein CobW [Pseudomonadota bacterium]
MLDRPAAKIPATIITGFLGSGKTTLIQNLLRNAGGKRIALIVNEFGDLGFDGEQIAGCGIEGCADDDVVELTNGCICCTVADDFLPTMEMLLARSPAPEHIVIETSGLALPQPLVQAFKWPSVAGRTTVDGVVTVADAEALAHDLYASDEERIADQRASDDSIDHETPIEELFGDQLRCADLVVLSKTDKVGGPEFTKVEAALSARRSGVGVVRSTDKGLPAELLIGLAAQSEDSFSGREASHHHHHDEHDHDDHDHDHDHHHDEFASTVLKTAALPDKASVEATVAEIAGLPGVLRVKGTVQVEGKPAPLVVQAVGPRVETFFDPSKASAEPGLVVIGHAPLPDLSSFGVSS